jgi:hypothetical protein
VEPTIKFRHPEASSILDRIAGALIALIFVALTILLLPLLVAAFGAWKVHGYSSVPPGSYTGPFFFWLAVVSNTAAIWGAQLGSLRTLEMLAHLWGTEQPANPGLTNRLWLGIAVSGLVTFLFALPWERLF